MGLLDSAILSPQTYGGAGGLLQDILRTAQINPTPSAGFGQTQDISARSQPPLSPQNPYAARAQFTPGLPEQTPQASPAPPSAPLLNDAGSGGLLGSILKMVQGNQGSTGGILAPIPGQAHADNAQLPPTSQPTQGTMLPQVSASQPFQQSSGGLFGREIGNTLGRLGAVLAPKHAEALQKLQQLQSAQQYLTSKGLDPAVANIVASNPTLLTGVVGNQLGIKDETNDVKNYKYDQANPAFQKYLVDLKQAGSIKNQVQIDQRGESEFSKVAGKQQAERFDKLSADALDAKQMISDMQSLRDIGSRIATGKTAEITAALGPYAEALGVKVDGLDDMQAYKAIVSRLAPRMRAPGSGSSSDTDVRMFLESLPGIGKTPGGNELIAQTFDAMAQGKIAAAEIGSKALTGEITRQEAEKRLRGLPDPLALWKKSRKSMAPSGGHTKPGTAPAVGDVQQGYRFKGGNPGDQNNWELVQ